MNRVSLAQGSAGIAVVALLAACGGGGGGGGGGASLPVVASSVVLSGTATYDSVPNPNGALVYADTTEKPVRGAVVEVLDASANVLTSTTTNDSGAYSVPVPANAAISVSVRSQLLRTGPGTSWNVSVRDNTQGNQMWSMSSPVFLAGAGTVRNLHATTGWGGSSYTGARTAAPFAILDTIYTAMQKVGSVAPNTVFPTLSVFWSTANAPASGNMALGQIGSTAFYNTSSGAQIYVLGKEDVDTDEFDASVIAHEWGHYYQSSFSRDDSPGGSHDFSDRVDRRLAFSEGWGNGWSGIALQRSNYTDSLDAGQADGTNLDLSKGPTSNPGWYRELSIGTIFWNLNQQVGFKPINDAMVGSSFRGTDAVTSIHSFASAFSAVAPSSMSVLTSLLTAQNITATPGDPFGLGETNAGGTPTVPGTLPLYGAATVGTATQACVSNIAGTFNKLGNFAYFRFVAPAGRDYNVALQGTAPANPAFEVYGGGGKVTRSGTKVTLLPGEYVLAATDLNSQNTCFTVTIQ
jgi:hypothetical protein